MYDYLLYPPELMAIAQWIEGRDTSYHICMTVNKIAFSL